jgi:hypothetical protein
VRKRDTEREEPRDKRRREIAKERQTDMNRETVTKTDKLKDRKREQNRKNFGPNF